MKEPNLKPSVFQMNLVFKYACCACCGLILGFVFLTVYLIIPSTNDTWIHTIPYWPKALGDGYPTNSSEMVYTAILLSASRRLVDDWFFWQLLPAVACCSLLYLSQRPEKVPVVEALLVSILVTGSFILIVFIGGICWEICFCWMVLMPVMTTVCKSLLAIFFGALLVERCWSFGIVGCVFVLVFLLVLVSKYAKVQKQGGDGT